MGWHCIVEVPGDGVLFTYLNVHGNRASVIVTTSLNVVDVIVYDVGCFENRLLAECGDVRDDPRPSLSMLTFAAANIGL